MPTKYLSYSGNSTTYSEVHIHSHPFHAFLAGGVFSHIHPIFTPYSLLPNLGNNATFFSNGERRRRRNDSTETQMGHGEDTKCSTTGMNLLSKFCIAVSATRKLNCVAVGVICVAVFFLVFWRKKFLNSVTLSQLNQPREF